MNTPENKSSAVIADSFDGAPPYAPEELTEAGDKFRAGLAKRVADLRRNRIREVLTPLIADRNHKDPAKRSRARFMIGFNIMTFWAVDSAARKAVDAVLDGE